jgi:hypothetical protein
MGNQQERSLAWLAGILDGEGSISFDVYTFPHNGRVRITPMLSIANTDNGILDETEKVLGAILDGKPHAKARWCNVKESHKSFKSVMQVRSLRVDGVAVRYILEALLPYMKSTEKLRRAGNILAFLDSRARNLFFRDKAGRLMRSPYLHSEIDLVAATRTAARAKSSEAIRSAPNVWDDDMVRTQAKAWEARGNRNDVPASLDLFGEEVTDCTT